MDNNVEKALLDLKDYIENTKEYRRVLELKKDMEKSSRVVELIDEIKKVQKEYVKNSDNEKLAKTLKKLEKKLEEIPIYSEYIKNLEKVNDMIFVIKEELNDYFDKKINI